MVGRNGYERWRGETTAHLEDIQRRLEEQKTTIESLGGRFEAALKTHVDEDERRFGNHDKRVGSLEQSHSKLLGKVAVTAMIGAAAISAFIHKLIG
jgi:hypothetical protein